MVQNNAYHSQRIRFFVQLMLVILFAGIPILYLLLSLFTGHSDRTARPRSIGALCAAEETDVLQVSRHMTLDFAPEDWGQYHGPVMISDRYTLENTADAPCKIRLLYPSTGVFSNGTQPWEGDERIGMWVDGARAWNWFCAADTAAIRADERSGTFPEKLLDGTYFSGAFPSWPELGASCRVPQTDSNSRGGLIYYETPVTLAPGQQAELEVCQIYDWVDALYLYPCYGQLVPSDFTLEIRNAENVRFGEQTVTDGALNANDILQLDPSRSDYQLKFTCSPSPQP